MSESKVFSFSIPSDEQTKLEAITELKKLCRATGQNFSHLCVEAIIQYVEARKDVKAK